MDNVSADAFSFASCNEIVADIRRNNHVEETL